MRLLRHNMNVSALLRALAVLTTVGASLGGFIAELTLLAQLDAFVSKNEMLSRRRLEAFMGGGALVFLLAALVYIILGRWRRDSPRRVEALHGLAQFLLPLTLLFLLPPIFRWSPWSSLPLELLLVLAAYGLALEPMLRLSISAIPAGLSNLWTRISARIPERAKRLAPPLIVGILALGYAVFAAVFTIIHHYRFGTACYDLGQYDNLFYNALHGHPFRVTSIGGEADWKSLRGHAEVGLYALLPFYAIRPSSEALLVIQAVLLGSAAIPLYLFGTRFISRWSAMFVTLAYVLYAPLHRSNFYDFHMQPIAAVYILWMLYFFIAQRNILFWLSFLLALTAREDISIGLAVFGTFLMLTGHRFRTGLIVTLLSILYFGVLKGIIMPRFGGWWFADIYKLLQIPGKKGYGAIVETLLSNPVYVLTTLATKEKLIFTLQILLPLSFLPVRRTYLAMSILPGFVFTLLTTGYNPTVSTLFQYNGHWIPYIFPASVIALRVIGGEPALPGPSEQSVPTAETIGRRRAALMSMLFLTITTSFHFGAILQRNNFKSGFASKVVFGISPAERAKHQDLRALLELIPKDASVAATEHVSPHVSARSSLYCFRDSIGQAEWVVYGGIDKGGKGSTVVKDLLKTGKFGVVGDKGEFFLIRKGADTSRNAEFEKKL